MVVQEGREGTSALGGAGLWRHYVEVGRWRVGWAGVEVGKNHLELDPVHPDLLEAGRLPGVIAIRKACGLGMGSGCKDEHQGGDGYYGDADADSILGTGHHVCVSFQKKYTRYGADFPGTSVPVLILRADCSLFALITRFS